MTDTRGRDEYPSMHSSLLSNMMLTVTYTGSVCEPSLVITPSLSISICLNVLTFCRISSSVYLQMSTNTQSLVEAHTHQ